MASQLPRKTLARRWRWLIGMSPVLVVAALAMAVAAPAQAEPRYAPGCFIRAVCFYDNVYWNHHDASTDEGDDGDFIQFWDVQFEVGELDGKFMSLNPDVSHPTVSTLGRSLVNRVSSYANNLDRTFCVYDRLRDGTGVLLWDIRPHSSSSWVGRKKVWGKSVNDRADHVELLRRGSRCPLRVPDRR